MPSFVLPSVCHISWSPFGQPLPAAAGACWTPDLPDNAQAVLKAFPKADCGGYPLFHKAPSLIGQLNLWKEVTGWSAPMA